MESNSIKLNDVFDQNLIIILTSFLGFEDVLHALSKLNKQFNKQLDGSLDYLWKQLYVEEFLHENYVDHQKVEGESYRDFFIRSFGIYQRMRMTMREIFRITLEKSTEDRQEGFLRSFTNRKPHSYIAGQKYITFQYECFYKNFEEKNSQQQDIIHLLIQQNQYYIIENYKLLNTRFYDHHLQLCLLSPSTVKMVQNILYQRYKQIQLPFMHVLNYRHSLIIDVNNDYQQGHGSLISQGGPDRTVFLYLGKDILSYMESHLRKLQADYYYSLRGEVESYERNPRDAFGSTTITNGVKIDAVANYIHIFSVFDKEHYGNECRYFFSYQIRISADPNHQGEFYKCQLKNRFWSIQEGDEVNETQGPGVIGKYPIVEQGMREFVYESCCPTKVLGTQMSGYFEFQYLEGPNEGYSFKAKIDPFTLNLEEGTRLIKNPIFEPWMHQHQ
eukprot:403369051